MQRMIVIAVLLIASPAWGGNFAVRARDKAFAEQIGAAAERARRDLAIEWLGRELPPWLAPCQIAVEDGEHLGAGGLTRFVFNGGRAYGFEMTVQGPRSLLLSSVVPHEVLHAVFATHFGRPLPRWADEGSCTLEEDASQQQKMQKLLVDFLQTRRGIPFDDMFRMAQYPRDILPLYAQGFSLCKFLARHGGKRELVAYVADGLQNDWQTATQVHYGYRGLGELQQSWLNWVTAGSPDAADALPVAASRIFFGNCRLKWDPVRRKFVRQCQPQTGAPALSSPPPAAIAQPAPQPQTQSIDIGELAPVHREPGPIGEAIGELHDQVAALAKRPPSDPKLVEAVGQQGKLLGQLIDANKSHGGLLKEINGGISKIGPALEKLAPVAAKAAIPLAASNPATAWLVPLLTIVAGTGGTLAAWKLGGAALNWLVRRRLKAQSAPRSRPRYESPNPASESDVSAVLKWMAEGGPPQPSPSAPVPQYPVAQAAPAPSPVFVRTQVDNPSLAALEKAVQTYGSLGGECTAIARKILSFRDQLVNQAPMA